MKLFPKVIGNAVIGEPTTNKNSILKEMNDFYF